MCNKISRQDENDKTVITESIEPVVTVFKNDTGRYSILNNKYRTSGSSCSSLSALMGYFAGELVVRTAQNNTN